VEKAMNRRYFLHGAVALLAAPAIVRVANIMPVKPYYDALYGDFEFSGFYSILPLPDLRMMAVLEARLNDAYAITRKMMSDNMFNAGTNENNSSALSLL
jgi:hypothetical protein